MLKITDTDPSACMSIILHPILEYFDSTDINFDLCTTLRVVAVKVLHRADAFRDTDPKDSQLSLLMLIAW